MIQKPLYDKLFVERIKPAEVTEGGIVVPQIVDTEGPVKRGRVVEVGEGRLSRDGTLIPLLIKPGDVVGFFLANAVQFKVEGKDYLMLKEEAVVYVEAQS